ncbi:MAG: DegT/DnrJ/EryC1/StrS family aminotransferase [Syntrophales bacterium]|jgi:dTDP-4-amino-4,6-dideoxygalactose transaminase|nr:DegT/DnrJ/EryC1/StrS family aminotransferase [Syntrophales bacterium]
MIPMVDLRRQYLQLKPEIDAAVLGVLDTTQFILGPNVSALEAEVARYHDLPHAVGVASGTDALLLALRVLGIGDGDEVITTPFTFIATAEVLGLLGAVPVFVDIDPRTFNIDPGLIEAAVTPRTRAIIPVHLFGQACDMAPLLDVAEKYGLRVIEDCAQAFGARYRGQPVGTLGDAGCFSFFPSKNLACYGDGGIIVTGNAEIDAKLRVLRNHGSTVRYHHSILGYNSRLDEIQAAIVRIKLRHIDAFNAGRRNAAEQYRQVIRRDDVTLPFEAPDCNHVFHQFTLLAERRDDLMKSLSEEGIASAIYYPIPLHRQEVFVGRSHGALPVTERVADRVLSLPMFPEITPEEIRRIGDVINDCV